MTPHIGDGPEATEAFSRARDNHQYGRDMAVGNSECGREGLHRAHKIC